MSLTLFSSDPTLADTLAETAPDGGLPSPEVEALRHLADRRAYEATGLDPSKVPVVLGLPLVLLLRAADDAVECMDELTLQARRKKLSVSRRAALKAAIESQLAYVVARYQASVQRL